MTNSIKKAGSCSSWNHTTKVYGGPGQQSFNPEFGNLIATHGGKRRSSRRKTVKKGKRRGSIKAYGGKRRKRTKRGGCGCNTDNSPIKGGSGSIEPSSSGSSLLTEPFSSTV